MSCYSISPEIIRNEVRIAVVQLKSPFAGSPSEIVSTSHHGGHRFAWMGNAEKNRTEKIKQVCESILEHRPKTNMLVLPEYCVPESAIGYLRDVSNRGGGKIIIAGSYQNTETGHALYRKNICPILVPGMDIIYAVKANVSVEEREVIVGGDPNSSVVELHWESNGKSYSIQVCICLDYAYYYNTPRLEKEKKGIIVVPMCTHSEEGFNQFLYERSGTFVAFCNAVEDGDAKNKKIGGSRICGLARGRDQRGAFLCADSTSEMVLLATLDLSHPADYYYSFLEQGGGVNTATERETLSIEQKKDGLWTVVPKSAPYRQRLTVINPKVYSRKGKELVFFFIKSDKYVEARNKIGSGEVGSGANIYGVLGKHDIILQAVIGPDQPEHCQDALEKNGPSVRSAKYVEVKKVLKFYFREDIPEIHGKLVDGIMTDKALSEDLLGLIRDWEGAEHKIRERFVDMGVAWQVEDPQDVAKASNGMRAFLAITLSDDGRVVEDFERDIVRPFLVKDQRVCSLYKVKGDADLGYHYVLDLLAAPQSVCDLIISIHELATNKTIPLKSSTYLIAERLSYDLFYGAMDRLLLKSAGKVVPESRGTPGTRGSNATSKATLSTLDLPPERDNIWDVVSSGESDRVEFKASLRWDYREGRSSKELEREVVVAVAAMANTHGGIVIVGVGDDGKVLGLKHDISTLGKKSRDGFQLRLMECLEDHIGAERLPALLTVSFASHVEDDFICVLRVNRVSSDSPVFVGREEQSFYIRRGNASKKLHPKQQQDYLRDRA